MKCSHHCWHQKVEISLQAYYLDHLETTLETSENGELKTTLETSEKDEIRTTLETSEKDEIRTTLETSEKDEIRTTLETSEKDEIRTTLETSEKEPLQKIVKPEHNSNKSSFLLPSLSRRSNIAETTLETSEDGNYTRNEWRSLEAIWSSGISSSDDSFFTLGEITAFPSST